MATPRIKEEYFYDEKYEFSAPRFFDFIKGESEEGKREAELWFETAHGLGSQPLLEMRGAGVLLGAAQGSSGACEYDNREKTKCAAVKSVVEEVTRPKNHPPSSSLEGVKKRAKPIKQEIKHLHVQEETARFVSVAEMTNKFQSSIRNFPLSNAKIPKTKKREELTPKVTEPRPPRLHTSMRTRPTTVKSSVEIEQEEIKKVPKFKARPFDKKLFESKVELKKTAAAASLKKTFSQRKPEIYSSLSTSESSEDSDVNLPSPNSTLGFQGRRCREMAGPAKPGQPVNAVIEDFRQKKGLRLESSVDVEVHSNFRDIDDPLVALRGGEILADLHLDRSFHYQ